MESTDRSTSREYEGIKDDLTQKYEFLKVSKEDTMKQEGEHYKSILRQVSGNKLLSLLNGPLV